MFSAALALYFYAQGIFREFFYWCFTYEFAYARVPLSDTLQAIPLRLDEIARGDFIFPLAGIAVAIWCLFRKQRGGYFLLGFLLFSFLGTVPGYVYPHYFVQLAPAVALAGGYAFSLLLEKIDADGWKFAAALTCSLLILSISIGVNRQYFLESDPDAISRYYFGTNPFPESKALGSFIAGATTATDRVLIVGSEPQILFYAARQSQTPFVMIYPLTSVHARYKEFQNAMRADVQKNPPKYILDIKNIESSFAWDGDADPGFLQNLSDFIARHYTLERRMLVSGPEGWIGKGDSLPSPESPVVDVYRRSDLLVRGTGGTAP